jgi:lathosterol oxidase
LFYKPIVMEHVLEIIGTLFRITVIRYFILAGIPFALVYFLLRSKLKKAKIQAKAASRKDFIREILHSMVSSLVLSFVAFLVLFTPIRQYTLFYAAWNDFPYWWAPVSLVLSLVIHDTYFYWMHRTLHHKSIFRFTHLVHHRSTNPSPWAAYSFHTLEAFAEGGVIVVLAFVLPMHPIMLMLFTITSFVINVYGHLGYEIMPKSLRRSFLFEVINTSVHHNMHHSKFRGNYGLYFRWWDRLMGTEHPDYVTTYDRIQESRFGGSREPEKKSGVDSRESGTSLESPVKKAAVVTILLCLLSVTALAQIEGN